MPDCIPRLSAVKLHLTTELCTGQLQVHLEHPHACAHMHVHGHPACTSMPSTVVIALLLVGCRNLSSLCGWPEACCLLCMLLARHHRQQPLSFKFHEPSKSMRSRKSLRDAACLTVSQQCRVWGGRYAWRQLRRGRQRMTRAGRCRGANTTSIRAHSPPLQRPPSDERCGCDCRLACCMQPQCKQVARL